jgi:DNA polymerase-3 subunit epsilon
LGATAEFYDVEARNAHSALGDAVAACAVARALADDHELIRRADATTMHSAQTGWHFQWAVHLQAYLRSRGKSAAVVDKAWPLRDPVVGRHRAAGPASGADSGQLPVGVLLAAHGHRPGRVGPRLASPAA